MHLFIALIHISTFLYTRFTRLFRHLRTNRTVPVVFDCPRCNHPRLANLKEHFTYGQDLQLVPAKRSLTCQTCRKSYNGESFHPDSTGVYQLKSWHCPTCKSLNPNTTLLCPSCGFSLV